MNHFLDFFRQNKKLCYWSQLYQSPGSFSYRTHLLLISNWSGTSETKKSQLEKKFAKRGYSPEERLRLRYHLTTISPKNKTVPLFFLKSLSQYTLPT